jgi:CxxC motif-containing protein (DUF1111 family)
VTTSSECADFIRREAREPSTSLTSVAHAAGGEAQNARNCFQALDAARRALLVAYLNSP